MEQMASLQHSLGDARSGPNPAPHYQARISREGSCGETQPRRLPEDVVPASPSPSQSSDLFETRSSRSASTASRTNRLSLTLPIAPPTSFPSRPTPVSSTAPSFPPTPLDTPSLLSPVDPSDFITAIAGQERRVLELREELNRAESDLLKLKKQWTIHEGHKKRAERRNVEALRPLAAPAVDPQDDPATKRSVELDRRKALLLGQQTQQGTPERGRRRVFRGGHTRTLSLLSPTKLTDSFLVHEDEDDQDTFKSRFEENDSPYVTRYAPITPAQLAKRASWAPRSTDQASAGVKQIAQDLKHGLWTFMEDLRQATVGEEPITGQGTYVRGGSGRHSVLSSASPLSPLSHDGDQDTIRASGANQRPRVTAAFDETPTPAVRSAEAEPALPAQTRPLTRSNTDASKAAAKRFSWTPLTVDSYDNDDWSNWDSPSVSSPRWSGTTVNGDIIPTIPEKRDETNGTPLKSKSSKSRMSTSSTATTAAARSPSPTAPAANKLEELLPPVLNRLTPASIKRAASDLMTEWEKSLAPPSASIPIPISDPVSQ